MLLGGDDRRWNLRPFHQFVLIEVAQFKAGCQQTLQTDIDLLLTDVAAFHGSRQISVFRAAFQVSTAQHGLGRCRLAVLRHVVPTGQEVADGSAVAGDETLEAPFVAQDVTLVAGITTAGVTVYTLVGTHHLSHVTLLNQGFKGGQVGLPQVALRQLLHVEHVAVPLWAAMYGKVLCTSQQLFIFAFGC